jgi:hypothetical protein
MDLAAHVGGHRTGAAEERTEFALDRLERVVVGDPRLGRLCFCHLRLFRDDGLSTLGSSNLAVLST